MSPSPRLEIRSWLDLFGYADQPILRSRFRWLIGISVVLVVALVIIYLPYLFRGIFGLILNVMLPFWAVLLGTQLIHRHLFQPRDSVPDSAVDEQLAMMYGDVTASQDAASYQVALERVLLRRADQSAARFNRNVWAVFTIFMILQSTTIRISNPFLFVPPILQVILFGVWVWRYWTQAFPRNLAQREREYAQQLEQSDGKRKNRLSYAVGADGELVEAEMKVQRDHH